MSRLRARTWTALERRVMWLWALRKGTFLPHKWHSDGWDYTYRAAVFNNALLAERTMRTKGICRRTALDMRMRGDTTFPEWIEWLNARNHARYPHDDLIGNRHYRRFMRYHYWQPSDFNPNILVRREA